MCDEIARAAKSNAAYDGFMQAELVSLISFSEKLKVMPQDEMESSAKLFFEKLTSLYQISLLIDALNDESKEWILPALTYLKEKFALTGLQKVKPLSVAEVKGLIAWEF